ncbi:MAG: sugar transferase [Rhodospirillales bacterium]|nr:sugar transferase [Rhodospirillales bacterium]
MTRFVARHVPPEMAVLWLFELLASVAVFYAAVGAGSGHFPGNGAIARFSLHPASLPGAALLAAFLGGSGVVIGLYRTEFLLNRRRLVLNVAVAAILAFPVALVVGGRFSGGLSVIYALWLLKLIAVWLTMIVAFRFVLHHALARALFLRRVLILGQDADALRNAIPRAAERRFDFVLPAAGEVPGSWAARRIWGVLLAEPAGTARTEALRAYRRAGARVFDAAGFWEHCLGRVNLPLLAEAWFLAGDGFAQSRARAAAKRGLDIAVSVLLLVLTFPLMLLVALAIVFDSKGPVFYRQRRVGLHGAVFTLFKFRSMRADAESGGTPRWASKGDDRITTVGRFIRATRIDELPQLVNVLRGEMSLVGPRPERPHFVEHLSEIIPFYRERNFVKPGITGWAQVNYPYGASVEDAREKLSYDLYYLKHRGLMLDLLVLIWTVRVILFREGAR